MGNKEIPMIKVKWSYNAPREAKWEVEENMRQKYPHHFREGGELLNFEDEIFCRRGEL